MIQRDFTCDVCQRVDTYDHEAEPAHCGQPMVAGVYHFPPLQDSTPAVHLIRTLKAPDVDWSMAPLGVWEVWVLRKGRFVNGERLGYLARYETIYEWRTPPGTGIPGGFVSSMEDAAANLLLAADGGLAATKRLHHVEGV